MLVESLAFLKILILFSFSFLIDCWEFWVLILIFGCFIKIPSQFVVYLSPLFWNVYFDEWVSIYIKWIYQCCSYVRVFVVSKNLLCSSL